MPLEVRELVIKVDVGSDQTSTTRRFGEIELAVFKREIMDACLAELRQQLATRDER
jgi:hypothetical protein